MQPIEKTSILKWMMGKPRSCLGGHRPTYHLPDRNGSFLAHYVGRKNAQGYQHDANVRESCSIEDSTGLLFTLVNNKTSDVVLTKNCHLKDIVEVGTADLYLESPAHEWPMHVHEMRKPHLEQHVLTKLPPKVEVGLRFVAQDKLVTPLVVYSVNSSLVVERYGAAGKKGPLLTLRVGMGFQHTDGTVGMIQKMGEEGSVSAYTLFLQHHQLPAETLGGCKPEEVFATSTVVQLLPSHAKDFTDGLQRTFHILPWSMQSLPDALGDGNMVLMGWVNHAGGGHRLHGLKGLEGKDVLRCIMTLARCHYNVESRIIHHIMCFMERCGRDQSTRPDGANGPKSNAWPFVDVDGIEVASWVGRLHTDGGRHGMTASMEGSMLSLELKSLRLLASKLPNASLAPAGDALQMDANAAEGGYVQILAPVCFNLDFHPFPQATMTVDSWELCSGLLGVKRAGTSGISDERRQRQRKARPRTVWYRSFTPREECEQCFPSCCDCGADEAEGD